MIYVFLGIIVLIFVYIIYMYNLLMRLKDNISNKWNDISDEIMKYFDVIINIENIVKEYGKYENDILKNFFIARNKYTVANNKEEYIIAYYELSNAVRNFYIIFDKYSDLEYNNNFLKLRKLLNEYDSNLSNVINVYNNEVLLYNSKVMSFPSNIVSKLFKFKKENDIMNTNL